MSIFTRFKSKKYYFKPLFILPVMLLGQTSQAQAFSLENTLTGNGIEYRSTTPIECGSTLIGQFSEAGTLCFPSIELTGVAQPEFVKAQLLLTPNSNPISFTLSSIESATASGPNQPTYAMPTGLFTIPVVEQHRLYGTERYKATLQLIPNTTPMLFSIVTLDAVISAEYHPGTTWKPYVGLLPYEKDAINLLQQSQPYATLAEAVYDFGTKTVGNWDLIQDKSTDAGMQAGVYRDRVTNALVIAFRGSEEICLLPILCSFKEIEESGNDLKTDAYLTQGKDSGQFNDAFEFTRDVIKANPNTKITVTGHSLGGGVAQAAGASFLLETFAFNSSPVPNDFWNDHGINQFDAKYNGIIHVLSDIHDPVSSTNDSGNLYADAKHVTTNRQFDFDNKEIMPTYKTDLDSLRFNKHSITKLRENIFAVTGIYQGGW